LLFKDEENNTLFKERRQAAGWKLLFDGHSTAGWHLYNSTGTIYGMEGEKWRIIL